MRQGPLQEEAREEIAPRPGALSPAISPAHGVPRRERLSLALSHLFGIDLRALAIFRIGVAVLILTDLAARAPDLAMFYSDAGVLPRSVLLDRTSPWALSAYVLSGAPAFQALLFVVAAVAALGLLLGYRTRWATIISWFLLLSLQNRNPWVNQNGDLLLHLILFWGIWLPLGARYSLDALRSRKSGIAGARILSVASAVLLAQVVIMYAFAAELKTGVDWRDGTAIYYALHYQLLATPRAAWLLAHPDLLRLATHAVVWTERLGPLLFFIPVIGAPIRTLAAFGFMGFHLGMSTFLALGPFMWVPEVALIPFLPTWFWDWVERGVRAAQHTVPIRAFAAASPAMLRALRLERLLERFGSVPEGVDAWIRSQSFRLPGSTHPPSVARRASHAILFSLVPALLAIYMLAVNVQSVIHRTNPVMARIAWLGDSTGLIQRWTMFAPTPPHDSGWFVIPGHLRDGTVLDLWQGPKPVSWQRPESVDGLYSTERWRKYAESLAWVPANQTEYAGYLCRSWNASHTGSRSLMRFHIYFMDIHTPPPGQPVSPPRRQLLVTWYCFSVPTHRG